jgi:hypothetical protein
MPLDLLLIDLYVLFAVVALLLFDPVLLLNACLFDLSDDIFPFEGRDLFHVIFINIAYLIVIINYMLLFKLNTIVTRKLFVTRFAFATTKKRSYY